jgi:hypothetical protein
VAERRLIDDRARDDEPALTAHLRRLGAPPALTAEARERIAATLRQPPHRRPAVTAFSLGAVLATATLCALMWLARAKTNAPSPQAAHTPAAPTVASPPRANENPVAPDPVARLRAAGESAVRAHAKPAAESVVAMTDGSMVVRARDRARLVDTPSGQITVRAHSAVKVEVSGAWVRIAAWKGSATFSDGNGAVEIVTGTTWSSAAAAGPAAEAGDDSVGLELLARAVTALRRAHDPVTALALIDRYRARAPSSDVSHEAALLEAEALVAAGRDAQALAALERLDLDGRRDLAQARDRLRTKLSGPESPRH